MQRVGLAVMWSSGSRLADRLGARCRSHFRAARIRPRPPRRRRRPFHRPPTPPAPAALTPAAPAEARADRGDARISDLSERAVHRVLRRRAAGSGTTCSAASSPFAALVKYYQSALKNRGTLVFDAPATHVFEIGRFREETMAFPPGVTVKDYTWNGSAGYLNPKQNGQPARFPPSFRSCPRQRAHRADGNCRSAIVRSTECCQIENVDRRMLRSAGFAT